MFDDECAATFVCYSCGAPESPLPLNPGQGSDSPGKIAATRSISVRGQRSHVPYPRWPAEYVRHVQSRGSVAPMILPPRAWGNWYWGMSQTSPSISRYAAYLINTGISCWIKSPWDIVWLLKQQKDRIAGQLQIPLLFIHISAHMSSQKLYFYIVKVCSL